MFLHPDLIEITLLSVSVSFAALCVATILSVPIVAFLTLSNWQGKTAVLAGINTLTSLPTVVIGLLLYILLSNSGALGFLNLLYTPYAMIAAQVILLMPLISVFATQALNQHNDRLNFYMQSLELKWCNKILLLISEAKFTLLTLLMMAMGRAISEVGAVMIVGGNINHSTRVMTTAIALETSKGNLDLAVQLGVALLIIALSINAVTLLVKK